jgi:hypothetical protein
VNCESLDIGESQVVLELGGAEKKETHLGEIENKRERYGCQSYCSRMKLMHFIELCRIGCYGGERERERIL